MKIHLFLLSAILATGCSFFSSPESKLADYLSAWQKKDLEKYLSYSSLTDGEMIEFSKKYKTDKAFANEFDFSGEKIADFNIDKCEPMKEKLNTYRELTLCHVLIKNLFGNIEYRQFILLKKPGKEDWFVMVN